MMNIAQYIDDLVARGKCTFSLDEAQQALEKSRAATILSIEHLRHQGKVATPAKGFYVIVLPEYRRYGCLPAEYFIPYLMQYWNEPYYACLASAAAYHGAAHQQSQVFQVMLGRNRKPISCGQIKIHFFKKAGIEKTPTQYISTRYSKLIVSTPEATAIDLAGRDVLEAVQMSVNPKVIDTPPVTAVAIDGIQLISRARVTVRANIKQLVGGAGEDTVLARVGEGIVSSIGSSTSHKAVLENPDSISRVVLNKGLDAGTAFEILSIDIADIDIGKNIGAVLQMDQAEADKNIAQAKAEERRAMAVALEQEMVAKAQEARAKVIEAEAQIPLAMADAFKQGNMGIMDYYKFKNIEADTKMRDTIGNPKKNKK